jgi:hypothetical protein
MVDYEQQSWKQIQHTFCILLTSPYGNQTPPIPHTSFDAPPNSLKESNANPKMKTMEKKS